MISIKKIGVVACVVALSLASWSALSARAYQSEYNFFNDQGEWVGSVTYPCQGRPIYEGEQSGNMVEAYTYPCDFYQFPNP